MCDVHSCRYRRLSGRTSTPDQPADNVVYDDRFRTREHKTSGQALQSLCDAFIDYFRPGYMLANMVKIGIVLINAFDRGQSCSGVMFVPDLLEVILHQLD